jgi:ABC-type multidrug transport system permease subunit
MIVSMRKVIAVVLSLVLIVVLSLATAKIINWLWFYGVAAVASLYVWLINRRTKD